MKLRSASLLVTAVLIFLLVACEPGMEVVFTNNTSQKVTVYEGIVRTFDLEPGESMNPATVRQFWVPEIKIVGEDGRVLLEDHITYEELEKMGGKIVITDPGNP